jgi:hypothetical protein
MTQDHYPDYVNRYITRPVTSHVNHYQLPVTGHITGTSPRHHQPSERTANQPRDHGPVGNTTGRSDSSGPTPHRTQVDSPLRTQCKASYSPGDLGRFSRTDQKNPRTDQGLPRRPHRAPGVAQADWPIKNDTTWNGSSHWTIKYGVIL